MFSASSNNSLLLTPICKIYSITITITLLHSDPTNVGYMRNTQIYKYIINQLIYYIIKQCAEFYLGFTWINNNIYEPAKIIQCFSVFTIQNFIKL